MKKPIFFTFFFLTSVFGLFAQVMITEIMYNPPESGSDTLEFIELYNAGDDVVDMEGYAFSDGVEFTFPDFSLPAGEFVVVSINSSVMFSNFGLTSFQWTSGSLSNGGELIRLVSADSSVVIDEVDYNDNSDWPPLADGGGTSLVLCDFSADNSLPESWFDATTASGVFVGEQEVFANPGATSDCISGPEIYFRFSMFEVEETYGSFEIPVVLANGDGGTYSVDIVNTAASSATIGSDFTLDTPMITFAPVTSDTQFVTVTIINDMEAEFLEKIVLELSNPTDGATINPLGKTYQLDILDDDTVIPDLVISEIMYNAPGSDDGEYLEITNNGDTDVELFGYQVDMGISYTFSTMTLAAGDQVLLVKDSAYFRGLFGFDGIQWISGSLNNGGETIRLVNPGGAEVDIVTYAPSGDWPMEADGGGPSLELCDLNSDNSLAESWGPGATATGVFGSGTEFLGTPNADNDCNAEPPMITYPAYEIGQVNTVNMEGVADSVGTRCALTGTVYGINFRPSGLQFTIVDNDAVEGIGVFNLTGDLGYTVAEGDLVTIFGVIDQFNGLTQIRPDSIHLDGTSGLLDPQVVTELGEDTESLLVRLENVTLVDPAQWTNSGSGFSVEVTDGVAVNEVRIDADSDVFGTAAPTTAFNVTGIGGQYDQEAPYTEGYQLLPRYISDIEVLDIIVEPAVEIGVIVYPNPTSDQLQIQAEESMEDLRIFNALGQQVFASLNPGTDIRLNVQHWPAGIYRATILVDKQTYRLEFIKQ